MKYLCVPSLKKRTRRTCTTCGESEVRVCVGNEAARHMRSFGKSGTAEDECVGAELNVGDKFVMRGEEFLVLSKEPNPFTPHAMPHVVVDKPFSFSGRHVPVRVFGSVEVRCQLGLVPEAFIHDFEPVTVDFSPRHTNCGRLTVTFSTMSFNLKLSPHRNPFAFCTNLSV